MSLSRSSVSARLRPPPVADTPWTARHKVLTIERSRTATEDASFEENRENEERAARIWASLPPELASFSSRSLDNLVDLSMALGLHPGDVSTNAILASLHQLSEKSENLSLSILDAERALFSLRDSKARLGHVQSTIASLHDTLSSTRPPSTTITHDLALLARKATEYRAESSHLAARASAADFRSVSRLLERTEELEEVERRNIELRREVGRFEGLPADLDLARVRVEEERRELSLKVKLQVLRDEMMQAAFNG